MANKNIPILKKKVIDLVKELGLQPAEALAALDPICERLRKESRANVEKGVNEFKRKNGIARIKTDY